VNARRTPCLPACLHLTRDFPSRPRAGADALPAWVPTQHVLQQGKPCQGGNVNCFPTASVKFVVHVVQHSGNRCEVLSGLELVMLICYSQCDQSVHSLVQAVSVVVVLSTCQIQLLSTRIRLHTYFSLSAMEANVIFSCIK